MPSEIYWYSPSTMTHAMEVAKLFAFASMGAIAADTIQYARFDWSILRGERKRRWPQLFYFGAKLGWWAYAALNLAILFAIDEVPCQGLMDGVEFMMGFLVVCCSGLLAARTVCVYTGTARTVVAAIVTVFGLGHLAAWMAGVNSVTSVWDVKAAQPWSQGGCNWTKVDEHYYVKYLMTMIYDGVVLALTVFGVARMGSSRIGEVLIRQGLIYFLIVTAANLVVCILAWIDLSPLMDLIMAVPSAAVSIMAATRLYVQLAEEAKPQSGNGAGAGRNVTSSQLSESNSASAKIASFVRRSHGNVAGLFTSAAAARPTNKAPSSTSTSSSSPRAVGVGVDSHLGGGGSSWLSSSREDLEKGQHSVNSVRVVQDQVVAVEALPPHLAGPHFLGEERMATLDPAHVRTGSLHHAYPRLSAAAVLAPGRSAAPFVDDETDEVDAAAAGDADAQRSDEARAESTPPPAVRAGTSHRKLPSLE